MCFSAAVSLGSAAVLLPVGGYCLAAARQKDRAYRPLAAVPLLFGLQQLCEGGVWAGLGSGNPAAVRGGAVGFLFFALAVWPAWIPLAAAEVEPHPARRGTFLALAAGGLAFGVAFFLPVADDVGRGVGPHVVGHSLRYDFSAVPAARGPGLWAWVGVYLAAVCVPLLASGDRRLRPIGALAAVAAAVAYALFREAFASVWCVMAAALSLYLAHVLYQLPARGAGDSGTPPEVAAV